MVPNTNEMNFAICYAMGIIIKLLDVARGKF